MKRHDAIQMYGPIDNNGRITRPGKFEGEQIYIPAIAWEAFLDGFADEQYGGVLSVEVLPEDKIEFPELKRRKRIRFYVRDDGFVVEV